jgi:hypothetical protein
VLTKLLSIPLDEPSTVARLVAAHGVKHRSPGGEILLAAFGKIGINTLVLFFQRNGQRQNLALRKITEQWREAVIDSNVGQSFGEPQVILIHL